MKSFLIQFFLIIISIMKIEYIPEYVPDNLKWYERDGVDTWYKKNKCDEFLEDTDQYFNTAQIINFDIIRNKR